MTGDEELTDHIMRDYTRARLNPADRAMLDYTDKLTRAPWSMQQGDLAALRQQGFSDRAILDMAQVVAYYAYVNRIADGLGLQLESYWAEGKDDY